MFFRFALSRTPAIPIGVIQSPAFVRRRIRVEFGVGPGIPDVVYDCEATMGCVDDCPLLRAKCANLHRTSTGASGNLIRRKALRKKERFGTVAAVYYLRLRAAALAFRGPP